MTKSTDSRDSTIGTRVAYLDVGSVLAGTRKRYRMLDSRELLRSLHLIKDAAVEEHTKNNIQILIDQVYDGNLNV